MAKLTRAQIREGLDQIPIERIIGGDKTTPKLTTKQKNFVKAVVEGKPKAQAYREAYNSKGNAKTRASNSSQLSAKTHIKQAIESETVRKQYRELHSATQWREHILQSLYEESIKEDSPPSARIQALALLGKVSEISLFEERKTTTIVHHKSGELKAKLFDKLKGIIDTSITDVKDTSDSLLDELRGNTPTPTNSGAREADDPHLPDSDPSSVASLVHSIPHNRSPENSQVLDSKGNPGGNVSTLAEEGVGGDKNSGQEWTDVDEK